MIETAYNFIAGFCSNSLPERVEGGHEVVKLLGGRGSPSKAAFGSFAAADS
jgi:hypothetical protein